MECKKPLEITVRTTEGPHLYTSGIIPLRPLSTSTTDITDEITEREPFDKPQTFRSTPDQYLRGSRDNNEGEEDSDPMSGVRQHNRNRLGKTQDHGTQSEQKSTRNVGTMSEPVKTRNFGNETQPQSSATQTSILLQQQQLPYDLTQQDKTYPKQITSQRPRHDSRTNGYYTSPRSTSLDRRDKYALPSSIPPRQTDYSDYDQHRPLHSSQYNDDLHGQYFTTGDDHQSSTNYRPPSPSHTQQHITSSTNLHRTPSPPVEYRSTPPKDRQHALSPTNRHRTPSPPVEYRSTPPKDRQHALSPTNRHRTPSPSSQRRSRQSHRSRSPSSKVQPYVMPSTSQYRRPSPPPQNRLPQSQRSRSSIPSKQHVSTSVNLHRTPSPPAEYRSTSPKDRQRDLLLINGHHTPSPPSQNRSRKTKARRQMASAETDTSLDGMKSQQHQGVQQEPRSTRDYGTITSSETKRSPQISHSTNLNIKLSNSPLTNRHDYLLTPPHQGDYILIRSDSSSSPQQNFRPRPTQNDSYVHNYEEIPLKHDELISTEHNRNFDRPKEYTPKPFIGDHHQQTRPIFGQRSDEEEQQATMILSDEIPNEEYIRELPTGVTISIPPTTVIQPDTLPRSYDQHKSSQHQKHDRLNNREKITELPLHHGQQRLTPPIIGSPVLNIGTENIIRQAADNEFTTPFETRYVYEPNRDFATNNSSIRSSTLKRDDLISRNNRILLLPVLNSSRTYVFEKQSLPANYIRQSRTNGNFYLATSPVLRSFNTSFQVDDSEIDPLTQMINSNNSTGHELRSQVA